VLVVVDDRESRAAISQALAGYATQFVQDGIAALSKLIAFRPDLVLIDADLPIVDGFKVLEHIRASLNVPVIVLSGSRVRSSDRVLSSELGADYFLTKPFSARELAQKARLLIARHRGINSWILTGQSEQPDEAGAHPQPGAPEGPVTATVRFTTYDEFAAQVSRRVEAAAAGGAPFSVVGCRLPGMTGGGGRVALQLFEIVRELARDTDPTTTNSRNDLLILLPDASAAGARAFAGRLRSRVVERINQEPTFWIRSFPESALGARATGAVITGAEVNQLRRASDDTAADAGQSRQTQSGSSAMRAATSH
jgi:DNA-binding response OmpR family regulator